MHIKGDEGNDPGCLQYGDWMRSSPLKKGSLFDQTKSSGEKLDEFIGKLRGENTESGGRKEPATEPDRNVARQLRMDSPSSLDNVRTDQAYEEKDRAYELNYSEERDDRTVLPYLGMAHYSRTKENIQRHGRGKMVKQDKPGEKA